MKKNIKKILKISIISLISLSVIFVLYLYISNIINEYKKSDELFLLSELSQIQNDLERYHIKYGKYPLSKNDLFVNKSKICSEGVFSKDYKCEVVFMSFDKIKNNFIYKENLSGDNYYIKFKTNSDSKEMNCLNEGDLKNKGCFFEVDINGIKIVN